MSSLLTRWIIILFVSFILGLSIISRAKTFAYQRALTGIVTSEEAILPAYEKVVGEKEDAQELGTIGNKLLAKGMPVFAALNFKQASHLDSNSRDAAYGWAYSLAVAYKGDVSSKLSEIKEALDRVEAVDPHYIPALKLGEEVALLENDQERAQIISDRLTLLQTHQKSSQSQENSD